MVLFQDGGRSILRRPTEISTRIYSGSPGRSLEIPRTISELAIIPRLYSAGHAGLLGVGKL
ncbi:hypothetical protein BDP81DRAFT_433011, partial [Colletotrichum phormii]